MRSSLHLSALSKHCLEDKDSFVMHLLFWGPSWQALLMKRWQRHLLMADTWLSVDGHMFPATNALFASYWQFSAWHVPYPSCTTWRTSMRNPHWAPLKSFITTFSPLLTDPGHDGHDFARRPSRAKRDRSILELFLDGHFRETCRQRKTCRGVQGILIYRVVFLTGPP